LKRSGVTRKKPQPFELTEGSRKGVAKRKLGHGRDELDQTVQRKVGAELRLGLPIVNLQDGDDAGKE
jgi:hypothetical protein